MASTSNIKFEVVSDVSEIKSYVDEDSIIKDLLETNIRQRGDIGGSSKKMSARINELERLYGVKHGNNQYSLPNNSASTQSDIASLLGISVDTLQNYKLLANMIPELEDLFDTGIVTKTTALAIMRNLSEEEQINLISSLDTTKRITQKQVQQYIDRIRQLESNPPLPDDYASTKRELQDYKKDYSNLQSQFNEKVLELQELRRQVENMKETTPTEQYNKKLKDSTIFFCSKVADFIEKTGGYVWLVDHLNELPDYERKSYISAVSAVSAWADNLLNNINN